MSSNTVFAERFRELILEGEQLLETRQTGGGERVSKQGRFSLHTYRTHKFDHVAKPEAQAWGVRTLNLLSQAFGSDSDHYKKFAQHEQRFAQSTNFPNFAAALAILKAADKDKGHANAKQELPAPFPDQVFRDDLREAIESEVRRNTIIYVLSSLLIIILFSVILYLLFGIVISLVFFFLTGIISPVVGTFTFKEWTPSKIHERVPELERKRLETKFLALLDQASDNVHLAGQISPQFTDEPPELRNGDAELIGHIREANFPTWNAVRVRVRFVNRGSETTLSAFRIVLSRALEGESWTLSSPTWGEIGAGHRNLASEMQNKQPRYVLKRGHEEDGWLEFRLHPPRTVPDTYQEFQIKVLIEDGFGDVHEIAGLTTILARLR